MLSADFVDGVFVGVAATITGLVVGIAALIVWSGATAVRSMVHGPRKTTD